MEAPPPGLDAKVHASGVDVTLALKPALRTSLLAGVLLSLLVAGAAFTMSPLWGLAGLLFVGLFAAGVAMALRSQRVAITERGVRLTEPSGAEIWIPLEDVVSVVLGSSSRNPNHKVLMLATRNRKLLVGPGRPQAHLDWIRSAVEEARATRLRRERDDGREYFFEKVVPEAVSALVGRDG